MNTLNHFDVDMSKFEATASYVVSIIKVRDHGIPPQCALTDPGREITPRITGTFRLMAAGSISISVADPV